VGSVESFKASRRRSKSSTFSVLES